MANFKTLSVPALRILQPIGEFFIGVMKADDLVSVAYADVRELEKNQLDKYMGINRRLSKNRLKQLRSYVNTYDATFPTSVILAVESENAIYDENHNILKLRETKKINLNKIAKIIDGQHRIAGLEAVDKETDFEISVAIFVGSDIATQANIFATVNLAQTKVNRSLAYDLLDYEKKRSPQKSAHHVAVALDLIQASPFYRRIKRLGRATEGREGETITQAVVVEMLLTLITDSPMTDRDSFLRRLKIRPPSQADLEKFPFRGLFIERKEEDITRIMLNYFSAVRKRWPSSWEHLNRRGNTLPKTNGFRALMRFLKPVYLRIAKVQNQIGVVPEQKEFEEIFGRIKLEDDDFNTETFPPGTSGEAGLYKYLKAALSAK